VWTADTDDRGDARLRERGHDPRDRAGGHGKRQNREGDCRRACPVEEIDLNRKGVQQVRQWKPHGADLLPAWRDVVKDPACDNEMAARVVVTERETKPVIMHCRQRAGAGGRERDARDNRTSR